MAHPWLALPVFYIYKPSVPGNEVLIDLAVMEEMVHQLRVIEHASHWQETGGMLGCDKEGRIVSFHFDVLGSVNSTDLSYWPDARGLETVSKLWEKRSIFFCGIIHTHNEIATLPSGMDLMFTQKLLRTNHSLQKIYMPILAGSQLIVYAFERDFLEWAEKSAAIQDTP